MNSRVRWVGNAACALLTVASACLVAFPAAAADAPADSAAKPVSAPKDEGRGDHPGYGGIGGLIGAGQVIGNGDYSRFGQTRMSFSASWRYTFANSWRWQVSPGFLWTAYTKKSNLAPFQDIHFPTNPYKDDYLTLVIPISTQIQWVMRGPTRMWHFGAGPGLYRVWVENFRKVVVDPGTFKPHRGLYPGASAEIGFEQFSKNLRTTSFEITFDEHYVFAKRDKQFPAGFNDVLWGVGLRAGVNYYFNLRAKPKQRQEPALPDILK